jgi:hypothetical protein
MKQGKKNRNENVLESCFFCNSYYSQDDFLMLEEQDQKTTFHVTCPKCNTSTLIFSSVTNAGIVSLRVATDLDKKEVKRMFCDNAINADDVLEMYELVCSQGASRELKN